MYVLLTENEKAAIRQARILELEREHYRTALQLAEMDALGVPAEDRGHQAAERDLRTIEATLKWHGIDIVPSPRVEPGEETASGDDGPMTEPPGRGDGGEH